MAKLKISDYSSTSAGANLNTDINTIDIDEGCAPSGINNAIRTLMAQLKDFQTGVSGDGLTLGGALSGTSATLSGALSGTSATFSGNVTASAISGASLTLSGNITASAISGASLTLSGNVTASAISGASMTLSGDLTVDTNTLYVDATNNRVGIGTSSPTSPLTVSTASGAQGARIISTSTGTLGPDLSLHHNSSSPADNDIISLISFQGNDSGGSNTTYSQIRAIATDVTDTTEDGIIAFLTTSAGSLGERMRIDSSGNVGIGTSSPDVLLQVSGNSGAQIKATNTTGGGAYMLFQNSDSGSTNSDGLYVGLGAAEQGYMWNYENNVLLFGTNNTERMRIDSNGALHVKCTASQQGVTSNARGFTAADYGIFANYNDVALICNRTNSTGNCIQLRYNGGVVGNIITNASSTTYATTSDYRLKENTINITDGIERVKLLKPYRFNFIAEPDVIVDGFYAHEVQDVVPEAISETKDAVDDEGNPVYQGIDQSKLVPLLTAALQEAITKIEDLEARIQTLENK